MSQRNAAVRLKISQPLLCKILKNRSDIETSALTNQNMDWKRARSGKDSQGESALKIWFSMFVKRMLQLMGLFCAKKQKNLIKVWAKKSSVQLMGGLTGGKSERILCASVCMVQKKLLIF
jgi:hypothetical protein